VKNLAVNFSKKAEFSGKMIHNSVNFLKNELHFNIESLIINFVSLEEIIEINTKYLNHNNPTDIITFDYSETKSVIDGEIYISVDEAERNSYAFKSTRKEEIIRLVTHGLLHLLGYNDHKNPEKRIMKQKEDELVYKQKEIWVE
jgi:probable rRNA maturation factor